MVLSFPFEKVIVDGLNFADDDRGRVERDDVVGEVFLPFWATLL
jgi:hypothetical protein